MISLEFSSSPLLTYSQPALQPLSSYSGNLPDLTGFMIQGVSLPQRGTDLTVNVAVSGQGEPQNLDMDLQQINHCFLRGSPEKHD